MIFLTILSQLIDISGKIGVFLVSILGLVIAYRTYKMELPALDVTLQIIKKDFYKKMLIDSNKPIPSQWENLYLLVQVVNTGKRIVTPAWICNDKKDKISAIINDGNFGYPLEENKMYFSFHPLNENSIRNLKKAKKIYIEELSGRKYFLKNKQFKKIAKILKTYKS